MIDKKTTLSRQGVDKLNAQGLTALAHAVLKSAKDDGAHDKGALMVFYRIVEKRGALNV